MSYLLPPSDNQQPKIEIPTSVAAKLLGVTRQGVVKMCAEGVFTNVRKIGRSGKTSPYLIDRNEVIKLRDREL